MKELYDVTTDYILQGIKPVVDKEQRNNKFAIQVLFIATTAFVFIGLFGFWGNIFCDLSCKLYILKKANKMGS